MTVYVGSIHDAGGFLAEEISPELVLVDPELAKAARSRLRPPTTAPPVRPELVTPPRPWMREPLVEHEQQPERQASRRVLIGVAAATMLALLFFDVRVEVGEFPASAEPEAIESRAPAVPVRPPKQSPAPKATTRKRPTLQAPTSRRFAWAPSDGASGYHVEFFRGSTLVYARETTRPELDVPARWRHDGVLRSFRPGEYNWYVWPVIGGRRAARASVQTTIAIPNG